MKIINSDQIKQISMTRAWNEIRLAEELCSIIEHSEHMKSLREFVAQAIEQIVVLAKRTGGRAQRESELRKKERLGSPLSIDERKELLKLVPTTPTDAVAREKKWIAKTITHEAQFMEVFKKMGLPMGTDDQVINKLAEIANFRDKLTISDCSDLIRLYTTITESKEGPLRETGFVGHYEANRQDDVRPWNDDIWKNKGANAPRARQVFSEEYLRKLPAHVVAGRSVTLDRLNRVVSSNPSASGKAGIGMSVLLNSSTILKIDSVFGLPAGADISGTTADSIFFMQQVQDFYSKVPKGLGTHFENDDVFRVMQLLPLATMVAHGHHSLLETAIVLSLNSTLGSKGYYGIFTDIQYAIGYYRTLLPSTLIKKIDSNSNIDPLVSAVYQALARWEDYSDDLHILCFRDHRGWKGLLFDWEWEKIEFKKFGIADKGLLNFFRDININQDFNADKLSFLMQVRGCGRLLESIEKSSLAV